MKPSLRNLFMKKLTLARVVPTISASISWLILATTGSVLPAFPKFASSRSTRANRFSLELKSWSTRSSSIRMLRESRWCRNNSAKTGSSRSTRTISSLSRRTVSQSVMAVAVDIRLIWPARQPSPKKSPPANSAMTASLPWLDTTVSFSLPFSIWKMESAGSPWVNTTSPLRKATVVLPAPTLARRYSELRIGVAFSFEFISSGGRKYTQYIFSRFLRKQHAVFRNTGCRCGARYVKKDTSMTPEEFRHLGYQIVDRIADYRATVAARPVMARTAPGEIKAALPADPPQSPEPFDAILADLDRIVMPGLSHWQHPSFFGYFPSNGELSSVLGDYLSTGLGVLGLSWQSV